MIAVSPDVYRFTVPAAADARRVSGLGANQSLRRPRRRDGRARPGDGPQQCVAAAVDHDQCRFAGGRHVRLCFDPATRACSTTTTSRTRCSRLFRPRSGECQRVCICPAHNAAGSPSAPLLVGNGVVGSDATDGMAANGWACGRSPSSRWPTASTTFLRGLKRRRAWWAIRCRSARISTM